jgi:GTP cyclohydrolase I
LLEQKQWIGYGDIGKDKLEKTMKQIAKLWQEVYIDNRDDTQVIIHLYSTVQSNGLILKDDVCDYKIIGGK